MASERLNWNIFKKSAWFAQNMETGDLLVARTKAELMSKINAYDMEENDE